MNSYLYVRKTHSRTSYTMSRHNNSYQNEVIQENDIHGSAGRVRSHRHLPSTLRSMQQGATECNYVLLKRYKRDDLVFTKQVFEFP